MNKALRIFIFFILFRSVYLQDKNSGDQKLNIPSQDDKIVIIGGGPSGVDMAIRLKDLGFGNVQILEQNEEVGGRAKTVMQDGIAYDVGCLWVLPRMLFPITVGLLEKYDMDQRVPIEPVQFYDARISCGATKFAKGCDQILLNMGEVVVAGAVLEKPEIVQGIAEDQYQDHVISEVVQTLLKYERIHREIFGSYEFRFLPRPANFSVIDKTAEQFLRDYDLLILKSFFEIYQTAYLFGYLNEIPAYYMLHLVNTEVVDYFIARITKKTRMDDKNQVSSFMKYGYQPLFQKMVDVEKLDVSTGFKVNKIIRTDSTISILGEQNGEAKEVAADFIFIAFPQNKVLNLLENPSEEEVRLFGDVNTQTVTTTLLKGSGFSGDGASVHSKNNANQSSEPQQKVWWQMFKKGWLTHPFDNSVDDRTIITYQYNYDRDNEDRAEIALDTLTTGGLADVSVGVPMVEEVFEQIVWKDSFPRYTNEVMKRNGGHWRILDIQGQKNTIYLGTLPSGTDTLEDAIAYNQLITQKIKQQL